MDALYTRSLLEIRDMLARGEVKPTAVLDDCLQRITALEPDLKATIGPLMAEEAAKTAAELEQSGPDPSKPLWGVPLMLKDCICAKNHPTTCASKMLENFVPFYDAGVVEKLRKAGAVLVAKTNMDEFAMGSDTCGSAMHPTANPWDLSKVPGGSSGGSAAAVAAREVYGALGSDTGGSIRQPASFCGCVGLKPTYGRVSRYGVVAYGSSLDQVGVLARNVPDTALLYEVIAGYDAREATSAPLPVESCLDELKNSRDLKGLRIGLPGEFWNGNSEEVDACCRAALDAARDLGAELVEVSLPHARYGVAAYYILSPAEASTNLARFDGVRYGLRDREATELKDLYTGSRSKGLGEEVKRRILLGTFVLSAGYYDAYYHKAAQVRRLIAQDYERAFAHCDLLAAPAAPVTAWPQGHLSGDPLAAYQLDVLTLTLNLAGLPGICIPAGLGQASRMPVGIQLFGKAFTEKSLLLSAHALSAALPSLGMPRGVPA